LAAASTLAATASQATDFARYGWRFGVESLSLFSLPILQKSRRMPEATYVAFVPKAHRAKLRETLMSEDTGEVSWKERKTFSGSEFYFSGPPTLVRKTHEFVTLWLTTNAR
jgi:hypothetical protein